MIYLDNATTTQPLFGAISVMNGSSEGKWGSFSAWHQMGQEAFLEADQIFQKLYGHLGLQSQDSLLFTASSAEANMHVILSHYLDVMRQTGRNHLLLAQEGEKSIEYAAGKIEQMGCISKRLKLNSNGQISLESLKESVRPRTSLLSLAWVNPLTGVVQPIEEIAKICREKSITLHVDATHAIGKLWVRFQEIGCDFLTFEGDKIHAPKGTGALLVRGGAPFSPFISNSAPFNLPAFAALEIGVANAFENLDHMGMEIARLKNKLEEGVRQKTGASILFEGAERVPCTSVIAFPGLSSESLLYYLNKRAVYATIGQDGALIQMLKACGFDERTSHSAISFTLSQETTEKDIDEAVHIICQCVDKLKSIAGTHS